MITEQDLYRNNKLQAEQMAQKEKERLELNKYCADNSVPNSCKAERLIDFQIKWGIL